MKTKIQLSNKKIQITKTCENKVATEKNNTIATSKIAQFATPMIGQLQLYKISNKKTTNATKKMFNTRRSCNSCKCKYLQPIKNRIRFSQYQTATQKYIRKKFLSNTTITTSAVIMVATQTNNRLQKKATKKATTPTKTV
jgi:hypothetical protein